jgi:hypothetical protein
MAKSLLSINKGDLKNIRNVSLVALVGLYVFFNYSHPCPKRLVFLLVTTILTFYLFNDIYCAVILSIVLSMAFTLLCKKRNVVEGLENGLDADADADADANELDNKEGLSNKKKPKKAKENLSNDIDNDNDNEDSGFADNFIDYNETMRNNLKNLDMKNIEKMTNETKDLLNTQKQLMKTMADMAPLLKQGMGMVDMFKKTQKK